jgi:hypothetical protein
MCADKLGLLLGNIRPNKLRMESSGLIKGCSCAQTEHTVHNRIQHDKNVLFIMYFLVLDLTKKASAGLHPANHQAD